MPMQIFLLFVSTVFFGYCLSQVPFVKKADFSYRQVLSLFVVKVFAGFAIGYFALHHYSIHNDYWDNNYLSGQEFDMLIKNPGQFFGELVYSSGGHYQDFWGHEDGYWNDMKQNAFIKLLAPFHAFTRGDYYLLSIIFNAFVFFGHVALYRTFKQWYKGLNWGLVAGCFLLPSFMLFSSGVHRDGFIFTALSFLFYAAQQVFINKVKKPKYYITIAIALFFIFFWRNYIICTLFTAAFAYRLISIKQWRASNALWFTTALFVATILLSTLLPLGNIVAILSGKQADYFQIELGASALYLPALQPTAWGFISNSFYVLTNVFFIFSAKLKILAFDLEWWLLLTTTAFLFFGAKKINIKIKMPSIWYALLLFTLLSWFLIGHITPNLGAIIRYRNMFLPFVFAPILAEIWRNFAIYKKK